MARSRLCPRLVQTVLLATLSLAIGCGDGTSARDSGAVADLARDLPVLDTAVAPADMPAKPVRDAADVPVSDVALDLPPVDVTATDTASDGASPAERSASEAPVAVDGASAADQGASEAVVPTDAPASDLASPRLDSAFVDPACSSADSAGFFASCSSCRDPGNCDSITVGSRTRQACGCEVDSDCPCGFRCACYAIAPSIEVCSICTR